MAYGGRLKALRVSHTAHALHDILGEDSEKNWIYYNNDFSLVEELRSPTHGIESWALHSTIKDKKEVEERRIYPTLVPSGVLPSTNPSTARGTENIRREIETVFTT